MDPDKFRALMTTIHSHDELFESVSETDYFHPEQVEEVLGIFQQAWPVEINEAQWVIIRRLAMLGYCHWATEVLQMPIPDEDGLLPPEGS